MDKAYTGLDIWCEAHNFPWMIINNRFYWQTNYQTLEMTTTGTISVYEYDYFDVLLKV